MDLNWLLPLAGFALITCGTPGPNNMLLTSAGAAQGFRRSVPLLVGVVGDQPDDPSHGAGAGVMFEQLPLLHDGLKLIGSAYLLWLAWKVATASGSEGNLLLIPAHQGPCCSCSTPRRG